MRFAIAIIFTSIVTLGGCSSCLEAFKRVEVGKPLPDKLPAPIRASDLQVTGGTFAKQAGGAVRNLWPAALAPAWERLTRRLERGRLHR